MNDDQREAMFNAWKEKHDREVKKCKCDYPRAYATDLNTCSACNGEIYKDYLNKIRYEIDKIRSASKRCRPN